MNVQDYLFGARGAAVPHRKAVEDEMSVRMPTPKKVTLAMSQHIGAPCTPTVKVGDMVGVGQCVGDSDKPMSAPIHSPVSGKVTALTAIRQSNGTMGPAVVIESDGEDRPAEGLCPPEVGDRASFLAAVRASGLVGLGGAGFPAHIKLNPRNPEAVDTLVVNGAECEPYITADYREMMESGEDVLEGVAAVMRWLSIPKAVIGIENNKPAAIRHLRGLIAEKGLKGVTVKALPSRYPQGAEKMLIDTCTHRQVPEGGLPADVGCIVMNVTSAGFLARYLRTGRPLIEKRVTVAGGGIPEPKNVIVAIGTPISEVLDFCGGMSEDTGRLLMGGPMMGIALPDPTLPVLKQNNAFLALTEEELAPLPATSCLRCGRCSAACPMHLIPTSMADAYERGDIEELNKRHIMSCLECGCCAYTCPAYRPLVQTFRLAKAAVRAAGTKK